MQFKKHKNKMLNNKRGITPLIATILLVGFVVVIITIVLIWGTDFVKDIQEKQGGIATTGLECTIDIQIAINNIEQFGNTLEIEIENLGENVDSLIIIPRGDEGQDNIETYIQILSGRIEYIEIQYNAVKVGTLEEVDVIPRIGIVKGVHRACSKQHEVYELQ